MSAKGRSLLSDRSEACSHDVDLTVTLDLPAERGGSWTLEHPILPASGTFGYGEEFEPFLPPGTFSAVVGKSISLEPRSGNAPPRTYETPAGLLNSIGLQNPGIELFLEEYLPRLASYGSPVVVNIVGKTVMV